MGDGGGFLSPKGSLFVEVVAFQPLRHMHVAVSTDLVDVTAKPPSHKFCMDSTY